MPGRYEWGKCLLLNGACRGPVHRLGSGGVAQNWELGALFFNHWAPLWLQPNHQGGSGLLKTITTRQWSSHQSVRSGTSCTSELPHSCRTCPAVWAAASRTAFPPADISESYCPISTSPFAASSSQPCAGPIVSGHPGNSFIQLRGLLGDFGCKLSAGRWGLRTTGPSGVSSRATGAGAGGWRGGATLQNRPESNGPPPACRNRFRNRSAGHASGSRALAGSTSSQPEIPREQSSRSTDPRVSGLGRAFECGS